MPTVVVVFCFSMVFLVASVVGITQTIPSPASTINPPQHTSLVENTWLFFVVSGLFSGYTTLFSGLGSFSYWLHHSPVFREIFFCVVIAGCMATAGLWFYFRLSKEED